MVFYALYFTAELDGLTDLRPGGGCDDPNYAYYFKVKCENCGEISANATCVSLGETVPLPTGRGTANLVQRANQLSGKLAVALSSSQEITLECMSSASSGSLAVSTYHIPGYNLKVLSPLAVKS